jgi:hypothetical protein
MAPAYGMIHAAQGRSRALTVAFWIAASCGGRTSIEEHPESKQKGQKQQPPGKYRQ